MIFISLTGEFRCCRIFATLVHFGYALAMAEPTVKMPDEPTAGTDKATHPRKKRRLVVIAGVVLALPLVAFIIGVFSSSPNEKFMTFQVTAPANTPADDLVFISIYSQQHRMTEITDNKWQIKLSEADLHLADDGTFKYRYVRNGFNFHTAEYLKPDTRDEAFRTLNYKKDAVQNDRVERWRWFPAADVPITATTDLVPSSTFLPRLGGQTFLSGQVIEDLYFEALRPFFNTTAAHMQKVGYNYVAIAPPEQWTEVNGMPKVINDFKNNPNYPDEATLKAEIKAFKDRGFTVLISPQLCCNDPNYKDRSAAWWDAYFSESTNFLVRYAKVAQDTGVDYFQWYIRQDYQGADASERYKALFAAVRQVYSGKIGEGLWSFSNEPRIIPLASEITWADGLDYFYVSIDHPLSAKSNPTDAELEAEAGRMLDGIKPLYDKFKKPVIIQTTYFNVAETWRGIDFYSIADVPWIHTSESELQTGKYRQSQTDQARVVNAYFKAIATRPWVIGYGQFGYAHWENPLSAELSVRGKQSEALWQKWNTLILGKP